MPIEEISQPKIGKNVREAPRVSVVVPAYNAAEFICETLDSALAQTFPDYEIIVVNDGSPDTDALESALENYFENIVYIKQKNGGAARARNRAIEAARGEWLAFLDADDVWFPRYIEAQLKALDAKNCDLIYADALLFGAVGGKTETFMKKSPSRGAVAVESLIEGTCSVITSGTIARRALVLECGLFDERLPRIGMEDFDLWIRLLKSGARLDYQPSVLLKYRISPTGLSGSNVQRAERSVVELDTLERKYQLNERERAAMARSRKSANAELELERGKLNLTRENFAEARADFRRADEHQPKIKLKIVIWLLTVNPKMVLKLFKKLRATDYSFINPSDSIARKTKENRVS